jgi:egghead protein (zeste-white 4 protein)
MPSFKIMYQFIVELLFSMAVYSMVANVSCVCVQVGAERQVSFDNGLDGSVAEDCFFAMRAFQKGFSFAFIEGEMWEKSPFSLWDFVQQRKR